MLLYQQVDVPDRVMLSHPTRAQLTKRIDDAIAAGWTFRLTSMPIPLGASKVKVTWGDMLEDYRKEQDAGIKSCHMIIVHVKWTMRLRRFLWGQYKELYIYTLGRLR